MGFIEAARRAAVDVFHEWCPSIRSARLMLTLSLLLVQKQAESFQEADYLPASRLMSRQPR